MSEQFQNPLHIYLGKGVGEKVFLSFDELFQWIETEQDFWRPLFEANINDQTVREIWATQRTRFNFEPIKSEIIKHKQNANSYSEERIHHDLQNAFSPYKEEQMLCSVSPQAKYIKELYAVSPERAFLALGGLAGLSTQILSSRGTREQAAILCEIEAALYRAGIVDSTYAEKEALSALHLEYQALENNVKVLSNKYENQINSQEGAFALALKEKAATLEGFLAELKTKCDDTIKTYHEAIKLKAPVTYWQDKAKKHRDMSFVFTGLFIAAILLFIALATKAGCLVLGAPLSEKQLPAVGAFLFVGFLIAIWILRLLIKVLLSHLHLGTDAEERKIMVQTYLSLTQDSSVITESDRQIILQSLFRPSSDGLVKDDNLPLSVLELLTRSPRK